MKITENMYLLAKEIVSEYETEVAEKTSPKTEKVEYPSLKTSKPEEQGVGKQYYWLRSGWKPQFSGMCIIISEGGGSRGGWQVRYVDEEMNIMLNRHYKLPDDNKSTSFAYPEELFDVIS